MRFAIEAGFRNAPPAGRPGPYADVAELVDAPDLGSGAARRGGSSPSIRTILRQPWALFLLFLVKAGLQRGSRSCALSSRFRRDLTAAFAGGVRIGERRFPNRIMSVSSVGPLMTRRGIDVDEAVLFAPLRPTGSQMLFFAAMKKLSYRYSELLAVSAPKAAAAPPSLILVHVCVRQRNAVRQPFTLSVSASLSTRYPRFAPFPLFGS